MKKILNSIILAFFLTACTDYMQEIDDQYDEWKQLGAIDPSNVSRGRMTDSRDGQTYMTVVIGSQIWMAENLNYKTENSYCYDDNSANCSKYGRLYSWMAALGACPEGWRLPTKSEFENLIEMVGGDSVAITVLRSSTGWKDGENGVDVYSFTALAAGLWLEGGGYKGKGSEASFWSSTEANSNNAIHMYLNSQKWGLSMNDKDDGASVRCVKGESLEKLSSSSITLSFSGVLQSSSVMQSSSSVVSSSSINLSSSDVKFETLKDKRDGQTYKTIVIGEQTWMAENLNYETENSYCYNDAYSNCTKYGRLYTWAAAMDSAGIWSSNGKRCGYGKTCSPTYPLRGVCPDGWHLPSQMEWNTLITAVGGRSTAGKVLKSTIGYIRGNGTDDYAFSGLPAGYRDGDGKYGMVEEHALFWSSTEGDRDFPDYYAYYMGIGYGGDYAGLNYNEKDHGYSVRCVRN